MRRVDDGVKIRGHRAQNVGPKRQVQTNRTVFQICIFSSARVCSSQLDRRQSRTWRVQVTLLNETGPQLSFRKSGVVPVVVTSIGLTCTHVTNAVLRAQVTNTVPLTRFDVFAAVSQF